MPRMNTPSSSHHRRLQSGFKYSPAPSPRSPTSDYKDDTSSVNSDRMENKHPYSRPRGSSSRRQPSPHEQDSLVNDNRSLPSFQEVIRGLDSNHFKLTPHEVQRVTHWQRILHPPPTAPSLSVFNCPNATYAWPNVQPASYMSSDPVLYVNYTGRPRSQASVSSEQSMRESSPESRSLDIHAARDARSGPMYASHSTNKHNTHYNVRIDERRSAKSDSLLNLRSHPSSHRPPDFKNMPLPSFNTLAMESSDEDMEDDYMSNGDYDLHDRQDYRMPLDSRHTPLSRSRSNTSSYTGDTSVPSRATHGNEPSQNWQDYASKAVDHDGNTIFECLWTTYDGNGATVCGYAQKKQLVKRHVETTHLHIKRFICHICQKPFPQKTSLNIHISGHTGEKPHSCAFNCGMSFKDPARKHKHEKDVHNKISKKRKEKPKVARLNTSEYVN